MSCKILDSRRHLTSKTKENLILFNVTNRKYKYSCHFSEQKFDDDVREPSASTILRPNFQENHQMKLAMKHEEPDIGFDD